MSQYFRTSNDFLKQLSFSFLITGVSQESLAGHIVAINGYPCCAKTISETLIFYCIIFLKCAKHNCQLDQVLSNVFFFLLGVKLALTTHKAQGKEGGGVVFQESSLACMSCFSNVH